LAGVILGSVEDLEMLIGRERVSTVFIASPERGPECLVRLIERCGRLGTAIKVLGGPFGAVCYAVGACSDLVHGIPLVNFSPGEPPRSYRFIKRALDIAISSFVLVLGAPLWGFLAVLVKVESAGPAIFRQKRLGKDGTPFQCYKFRSMYAGAEGQLNNLLDKSRLRDPIFKMKDDPRVTRVGRFLRRSSLDEIPQFVNVLFGQMSLVGPRPPLPREVENYSPWHRERLKGKPGITGLWQVSGRSELGFDEMVLLDIYYLHNPSIFFDLRILAKTLIAVLFAKGAY